MVGISEKGDYSYPHIMPDQRSNIFSASRSRVVATISSPAGWQQALALEKNSVDLLEVRLDLLLADETALPGPLTDLPLPILLTVRGPGEGGRGPAEEADRLTLYRLHLPHIAALDLELASAATGGALLAEAKEAGVAIVLSIHNFETTPPVEELEMKARRAAQVGADIFKVATTTNTVPELIALLTWFDAPHPLPLAAMGMGRLGKISRPLLAQLGSQLNYGYLDHAVVTGQWPAAELRRFLNELS